MNRIAIMKYTIGSINYKYRIYAGIRNISAYGKFIDNLNWHKFERKEGMQI